MKCEVCDKDFLRKELLENCEASFCDDCGDYHSGLLCKKCRVDACKCSLCVMSEELKRLTKADRKRLCRALELYSQNIGMYPKGVMQAKQFKKLEELGYLRFWQIGFTSWSRKKEAPLYKLTTKGRGIAQSASHWRFKKERVNETRRS